MTWLQEQLTKMGATPSQVNSSTVKMVERAMVEDTEFIQKTALDAVERLANTFEEAKQNIGQLSAMVENAEKRAGKIVSGVTEEAKKEVAGLESQVEELRRERFDLAKGTIRDTGLAEAVKAYREVLQATKDVFGEEIEKHALYSCIEAAINAGSYIAWRGIMGPKSDDNLRKRAL